jgi:hypothetical protein
MNLNRNDNVVFVKRVSRKKKEVPIVPEPKVQMELPPPEPPKPPRPELTPQQRILKSQYEGMFSGGFMNNNFNEKTLLEFYYILCILI